jgi:hypothetical protein
VSRRQQENNAFPRNIARKPRARYKGGGRQGNR